MVALGEGWFLMSEVPLYLAAQFGFEGYRGTLLIRNCLLLGPFRRPKPRALRCC